MKKQLTMTFILFIVVFSLFGCKKKNNEQVTQPAKTSKYEVIEQNKNNENSSKKDVDEELSNDEISELLDDSEEDVLSELDEENENTKSSSKGTKVKIIEEAPDYSEMEFERHENVIFECNYIKDATQKSNSVTLLQTKVTGSISGLSGSFDLIVPYSLEWKRGDKAIVNYEIAYEDEFESYIRDLEFVTKCDNEWLKRQEQIKAEEEAEAERIRQQEEEERLAEEERLKQEEEERQKKEAAEKARKEKEAAIKRAEQEAERKRQEEIEAAQRAIEESQAAEEAKKAQVIGPR